MYMMYTQLKFSWKRPVCKEWSARRFCIATNDNVGVETYACASAIAWMDGAAPRGYIAAASETVALQWDAILSENIWPSEEWSGTGGGFLIPWCTILMAPPPSPPPPAAVLWSGGERRNQSMLIRYCIKFIVTNRTTFLIFELLLRLSTT